MILVLPISWSVDSLSIGAGAMPYLVSSHDLEGLYLKYIGNRSPKDSIQYSCCVVLCWPWVLRSGRYSYVHVPIPERLEFCTPVQRKTRLVRRQHPIHVRTQSFLFFFLTSFLPSSLTRGRFYPRRPDGQAMVTGRCLPFSPLVRAYLYGRA